MFDPFSLVLGGTGIVVGFSIEWLRNKARSRKSPKPTLDYGDTGPLDIERIASLIECGVLKNKPLKGDIVKIYEDGFHLHILLAGWQWNSSSTYGEYKPQFSSYHATCYGDGENHYLMSLSPAAADRLQKAINISARGKMDTVLDSLHKVSYRNVLKELDRSSQIE